MVLRPPTLPVSARPECVHLHILLQELHIVLSEIFVKQLFDLYLRILIVLNLIYNRLDMKILDALNFDFVFVKPLFHFNFVLTPV